MPKHAEALRSGMNERAEVGLIAGIVFIVLVSLTMLAALVELVTDWLKDRK